jgi:thiosulfate/3-mercaptopyruvate sulfurtransferase
VIDAPALRAMLGRSNLAVVDLGRADTYAQAHVPGAVHLDYRQIVAARLPAMGLLPSTEQLAAVLSGLGVAPTNHIVAYDDEGGGRAARFLWTLDVLGHPRCSLLNGGIQAWVEENGPVSQTPGRRPASNYRVTLRSEPVADQRYLLDHLRDATVAIVDTRTAAEYTGASKRAERAGHIPGAINFGWVKAMAEPPRNLRLRPADQLVKVLAGLGVTPDKRGHHVLPNTPSFGTQVLGTKAPGLPKSARLPGLVVRVGKQPGHAYRMKGQTVSRRPEGGASAVVDGAGCPAALTNCAV